MFTCRVLAELIMCSSTSVASVPILPINFDLRSVEGSYQEARQEPAVLYFYTPEPRPARWTMASAESEFTHLFTVREQFTPGLKIVPGRIRLRFQFDEAGTYVSKL